jgi:ABC-type nitrate/sulfonate/bicarbonate transport system substrate-binding protein
MSDSSVAARQGQFSRRRFLGTGLAAAGGVMAAGLMPGILGAEPASAATLEKMAYQLSWVKDAEFAGSFLAQKKGYYAKHGLEVDLLAGGASVIPEPVVVSGKALVASSAADAVAEANAQGANLKIIGVRYQKNPYCIMSLAKTPVKTPQDLYGKKLGVAAGDEVGWQTFAKVAGLDVSKVTIFPVQYDPTPLADGEIDALVAFITSEPSQLQVKGIQTHEFLFADYGYAIYSDIYEVTEETLATKEKELVAFMKAEKAGWTYDINNLTEGTKVALTFAKSSGLSYKQQLLENKQQMALFLTPYTKQHGIFTMDPADIEANVKTLAVAGVKTDASMFTNQIVSQI